MSEHKIKRNMRVFGWTKASHKSAVRYFSNEREDRPYRSLKRKKKCKFNNGVHEFKKQELDFIKRIYCHYVCIHCGKQKWGNNNMGILV